MADQLGLIAWDLIKDVRRITDKVISRVHRMIVVHQEEIPNRLLGHYRDQDIMIAGRMGTPPDRLQALMDNWFLDMINYRKLSPKEMHVRFEKIHPFIDGNGRTGRMLMWWHEIQLGREPTLIKNSEKEKYYQWFADTEEDPAWF